jgi:hypothetical protein
MNNLQLLNSIISQRVEIERNRRQILETKASILLAVAGVIIGFILDKKTILGNNVYIFYALSGMLFLSICFSLAALWGFSFKSGVGLEKLRLEAENSSEEQFLKTYISLEMNRYYFNQKINNKKAYLIGISLVFLLSTMILTIFGYLVNI